MTLDMQGLRFGARGGQHLWLWSDPPSNRYFGIGIQDATLYNRCGGGGCHAAAGRGDPSAMGGPTAADGAGRTAMSATRSGTATRPGTSSEIPDVSGGTLTRFRRSF